MGLITGNKLYLVIVVLGEYEPIPQVVAVCTDAVLAEVYKSKTESRVKEILDTSPPDPIDIHKLSQAELDKYDIWDDNAIIANDFVSCRVEEIDVNKLINIFK